MKTTNENVILDIIAVDENQLIPVDEMHMHKSLAIAEVDKDKHERVKNIAIENALSAINKNQQVVDEFTRFVMETDDPRAYEIFSKMMLNTARLSEKLMNTVYGQQKNENISQQQPTSQTNIQQNNYIMNPADLIKQLKQGNN